MRLNSMLQQDAQSVKQHSELAYAIYFGCACSTLLRHMLELPVAQLAQHVFDLVLADAAHPTNV
jgi:hypothetical protein